jgi:molybdopterin synthase sulfur carrier subunit
MEIKFYATLRSIVGGPVVHLDGVSEITVEKMLQEFYARYPDMRAKLVDDKNELYSAVHIIVNGRDIRHLDGLETVVTAKDEVRIFPPVGGGV